MQEEHFDPQHAELGDGQRHVPLSQESRRQSESSGEVSELKGADEADAEELDQVRQSLAKERQQVEGATEASRAKNIWQDKSEQKMAEERIARFTELKESFERMKEELLGAETLTDRLNRSLPSVVVKAAGVLRNFTRMFGDLLLFSRSRKEMKNLTELNPKASIISRDGIFEDEEFKRLLVIDENRRTLRQLLSREVFKEINCENFLLLEGITKAQLTALCEELGYNPRVFLSDNRQEDLRIAIDNEPLDGQHPFADILDPNQIQEEMHYWQAIFPDASDWAFWSKWRMSRTHSVVYAVKDGDGKEVLILPIHVDPKNAVAFAADMFARRKTGEKSALAYHKTAAGEDPKYVGTGLYDLGIAYFIRLLRKAGEAGIIKGLEVEGEDKLETSYSIVDDDRVTWEVDRLI